MISEQAPFTWRDFCQAYNIPNHVYAVGFNWHWRPALHRFLQGGASITHVNRVEKVPDRQVAVVWGGQRLRPGEGQNITLVRLEDGFLRSVGLGAEFQQPLSWVADFEHLYFSARGESRLETLLAPINLRIVKELVPNGCYWTFEAGTLANIISTGGTIGERQWEKRRLSSCRVR